MNKLSVNNKIVQYRFNIAKIAIVLLSSILFLSVSPSKIAAADGFAPAIPSHRSDSLGKSSTGKAIGHDVALPLGRDTVLFALGHYIPTPKTAALGIVLGTGSSLTHYFLAGHLPTSWIWNGPKGFDKGYGSVEILAGKGGRLPLRANVDGFSVGSMSGPDKFLRRITGIAPAEVKYRGLAAVTGLQIYGLLNYLTDFFGIDMKYSLDVTTGTKKFHGLGPVEFDFGGETFDNVKSLIVGIDTFAKMVKDHVR